MLMGPRVPCTGLVKHVVSSAALCCSRQLLPCTDAYGKLTCREDCPATQVIQPTGRFRVSYLTDAKSRLEHVRLDRKMQCFVCCNGMSEQSWLECRLQQLTARAYWRCLTWKGVLPRLLLLEPESGASEHTLTSTYIDIQVF